MCTARTEKKKYGGLFVNRKTYEQLENKTQKWRTKNAGFCYTKFKKWSILLHFKMNEKKEQRKSFHIFVRVKFSFHSKDYNQSTFGMWMLLSFLVCHFEFNSRFCVSWNEFVNCSLRYNDTMKDFCDSIIFLSAVFNWDVESE